MGDIGVILLLYNLKPEQVKDEYINEIEQVLKDYPAVQKELIKLGYLDKGLKDAERYVHIHLSRNLFSFGLSYNIYDSADIFAVTHRLECGYNESNEKVTWYQHDCTISLNPQSNPDPVSLSYSFKHDGASCPIAIARSLTMELSTPLPYSKQWKQDLFYNTVQHFVVKRELEDLHISIVNEKAKIFETKEFNHIKEQLHRLGYFDKYFNAKRKLEITATGEAQKFYLQYTKPGAKNEYDSFEHILTFQGKNHRETDELISHELKIVLSFNNSPFTYRHVFDNKNEMPDIAKGSDTGIMLAMEKRLEHSRNKELDKEVKASTGLNQRNKHHPRL